MGVILDTSVLVEQDRGGFSLLTLRADFAGQSVGVAAITASELLFGAYRTRDVHRRVPQLARADSVATLHHGEFARVPGLRLIDIERYRE